MKLTTLLTLPALALTGVILLAQQPGIAPEMLDKIKAALPSEPAVKPKAVHEVLVFSKTNGFRHSSIEVGTQAMKMLGEKTGAFNVTATEDEKIFTPETLKKFDAIIFLNTTGEVFRPKDMPSDSALRYAEEQKEIKYKNALLDFVRNGKGLVGMHSATDTCAGWPEYQEMMGGTFGGHPWHENVGVRNLDPASPINKVFNQKGFEITDEIYQWKPGSFSTTQHRVLLALDTEAVTNMKKDGTNGPTALYPISVMRKYGEGRVFYCSLGHREEIYWNPNILQHYLAGIQFALGDLEAETETGNAFDPTAKPPQ